LLQLGVKEPAVQVIILKCSCVGHVGYDLHTRYERWPEEETAQLWWPVPVNNVQKAEE